MSATRSGILVDGGVEILPKPRDLHAGRACERGNRGFGCHKHPLAQRDQLANGYAIACNDEGFAPVQGPHDPPAFVSELPLRDCPAHLGAILTGVLRAGRAFSHHPVVASTPSNGVINDSQVAAGERARHAHASESATRILAEQRKSCLLILPR